MKLLVHKITIHELNDRVCEQQLSYGMRVFFVFSYCLEWNLLFENLTYLLIVVPIYTTIPLSPVFSVCIMRNAHSDLRNANALSGRQGGRKPVGDIYV